MNKEIEETRYEVSVFGEKVHFLSSKDEQYINLIKERLNLFEMNLVDKQLTKASSSYMRKLVLSIVYDTLEEEENYKLRLNSIIEKLNNVF